MISNKLPLLFRRALAEGFLCFWREIQVSQHDLELARELSSRRSIDFAIVEGSR
jgi:hypothetical protein